MMGGAKRVRVARSRWYIYPILCMLLISFLSIYTASDIPDASYRKLSTAYQRKSSNLNSNLDESQSYADGLQRDDPSRNPALSVEKPENAGPAPAKPIQISTNADSIEKKNLQKNLPAPPLAPMNIDIKAEDFPATKLLGDGLTFHKQASASLRTGLAKIVSEFNISSMLDAPCGDMTWMPIFLESAGQAVSYHGCDYLSSVIETAKKKFTPLHPEWEFTRCDLTKELPLNGAFDLLFTHQLLSFLPRDKILEVIHTVKNGQARYWMVNAHDKVQKNNRRLSRSGGESRTINLLGPPYNLDKEWIVSTVDTSDDPETSFDTDKMVVIDMKMLREGWPSKSVDGSDEKIAVEKDRFDHDRYHRMQNGDMAEHHDAQEVDVEAELPAEGPGSDSEDFDPMSNNFIGSGGSLDDREGDFLAEENMDYMGVKPDKAPKYRDSQDGDHSIPESTLSATKSLRKGMGRLINKFRIKSMLDAPCGEMTWMPAFLEEYGDDVHYTGCDILSSIVRRGNKHIATSGSEFIRCDLTTWLPNDGEYDLVITRNTLHSLTNSLVMDALHVVKDSKIKYWLVENYNGNHANHELPEGVNAHRPVNLFTYPFNFERDWVIDTIEEKEADPRHSEDRNRHKSNHEGHFQMVLIDVQMIRDFWEKHRQITRT